MADRIRLKSEYGFDQFPDSRVLISSDTRSTNLAPRDCPQGVQVDFKKTASIGFDETAVGHTYCTLITIRSYTDMSAGIPQQMAIMDNGKMYKRHATSGSAWSEWTVMDSAEDYEYTFSWSAGTIGTRGGAQTFTLGYVKPSSVYISYITDSTTLMPQAFVYRSGDSPSNPWVLGIVGYRATSSAVSNNRVKVTVCY